MAIGSKTLLEVLKLSGKERQILARALQDEQIMTEEGLSAWISQSIQDETVAQGKENRKQADAMKKIPAGVAAAHAFVELDDLIYDLSLIRDAAWETDLDTAVGGHYRMFLEAVDGIANKMCAITKKWETMNVLYIVADETEKPSAYED